jgi:hypothetical protein
MDQFLYDDERTFDENFTQWFLMNSDEKIAYNQKPYERKEAKKILANYVSERWLEDQKKKNQS